MDTRVDLDVVGVLEGSGRSSAYRQAGDTLRHYETILGPYRKAPLTILDLAAQTPGSLAVWSWYFPQARIVAVSTDPEIAAVASENVTIEAVNPANAGAVERIAVAAAPTIVLDDASHRPDHVLPMLERVLRHVAPGGTYIIENLCAAPGTDAPRPEALQVIAQLAELAGQLAPLRAGHRFARAELGSNLALAESVTFLNGAAALRRRGGEPDLGRALTTADAYLAAHKRDAAALERLAGYILRHKGPISRAEEAANAALAAEGPSLSRLLLLAEINALQQRPDELAEALGEAQTLSGSAADHARLARLLAQHGQKEAALAQAQTAATLAPRNPAFARLVETLSA